MKSRIGLILFAATIIVISLIFTDKLAASLAREEHRKMEIWAEATRLLLNDEYSDFIFNIIEQNENIPVIIVDDRDRYISARNFREPKINVNQPILRKTNQTPQKHQSPNRNRPRRKVKSIYLLRQLQPTQDVRVFPLLPTLRNSPVPYARHLGIIDRQTCRTRQTMGWSVERNCPPTWHSYLVTHGVERNPKN